MRCCSDIMYGYNCLECFWQWQQSARSIHYYDPQNDYMPGVESTLNRRIKYQTARN
jgi:hypothetical protein